MNALIFIPIAAVLISMVRYDVRSTRWWSLGAWLAIAIAGVLFYGQGAISFKPLSVPAYAIFGGLMIDSFIASFHRLSPSQVQLIARNTEYFAKPDTPEARAVSEAFSNSLLSAAPVVSQPHPERKSVLIEANALLLADIPGANGMLERAYRQSYSFDPRNSSITKARATPDLVAISQVSRPALYVNDAGRRPLGIGPDEQIFLSALRPPDSPPQQCRNSPKPRAAQKHPTPPGPPLSSPRLNAPSRSPPMPPDH